LVGFIRFERFFLQAREKQVIYNQKKIKYIRFEKPMMPGESRAVWFDLNLNYFRIWLGDLNFSIKDGARGRYV
jgi:hypothetical protein